MRGGCFCFPKSSWTSLIMLELVDLALFCAILWETHLSLETSPLSFSWLLIEFLLLLIEILIFRFVHLWSLEDLSGPERHRSACRCLSVVGNIVFYLIYLIFSGLVSILFVAEFLILCIVLSAWCFLNLYDISFSDFPPISYDCCFVFFFLLLLFPKYLFHRFLF